MRKLVVLGRELDELERKKVDENKKKSGAINHSFELASMEQNNADQDFVRLIELEPKRLKEDAAKMILQLEKLLDSKQKLEMENQQLKRKLQAWCEDNKAIKKKMKKMNKELGEKLLDLEELEEINSTMWVKERQNNDDIQEARKELIVGLPELLSSGANIGIKRVGGLDDQPFQKICKQKFPLGEAMVRAIALCSRWQENLMDPGWHPFKIIGVGDKKEEVVDEGDGRLKRLKAEWGDEVHNAVKIALEELNEHNPSGRFPVQELWNFEEGRKARLKEVVVYLMDNLKKRKQT